MLANLKNPAEILLWLLYGRGTGNAWDDGPWCEGEKDGSEESLRWHIEQVDCCTVISRKHDTSIRK